MLTRGYGSQGSQKGLIKQTSAHILPDTMFELNGDYEKLEQNMREKELESNRLNNSLNKKRNSQVSYLNQRL